jgi:hypothetical protein
MPRSWQHEPAQGVKRPLGKPYRCGHHSQRESKQSTSSLSLIYVGIACPRNVRECCWVTFIALMIGWTNPLCPACSTLESKPFLGT